MSVKAISAKLVTKFSKYNINQYKLIEMLRMDECMKDNFESKLHFSTHGIEGIFRIIIAGRKVSVIKIEVQIEVRDYIIKGRIGTGINNSFWPRRFWISTFQANYTVIARWDNCCEIALRRMSLDLTDDKSTLIQVMAWCRQATSHYMSQCWPRSLAIWHHYAPIS